VVIHFNFDAKVPLDARNRIDHNACHLLLLL
jgi:hypothetical protein